MVNFQDPAVVLQDDIILLKLWHFVHGLYIWEFFTTLGYELDIIRGRRPYRWTIWMYSLTRVAALVATVLSFIGFDVTTQINCQVWLTSLLSFSYFGVVTASFLIVLRITAIWNNDKIVVTTSVGVWLVNVAVIIQGIVRLRSTWDPVRQTCIVDNSEENKLNIIVTSVFIIALLFTLLAGLLRLRRDGRGRFGIVQFLWNQSVLWLLLATVAEVPATVLIILNLNGPLNLMLQLPGLVIFSIAATRIYRALTDFVSESTDIVFEYDPARNNKPTNPSALVSSIRFGAVVNTSCSQPDELSLDTDLESAV